MEFEEAEKDSGWELRFKSNPGVHAKIGSATNNPCGLRHGTGNLWASSFSSMKWG